MSALGEREGDFGILDWLCFLAFVLWFEFGLGLGCVIIVYYYYCVGIAREGNYKNYNMSFGRSICVRPLLAQQ
jgi:hypothetical protein